MGKVWPLVLLLLTIGGAYLYGSWEAKRRAEATARADAIEAELADTLEALEVAREAERSGRQANDSLQTALEEARAADVAAADTAEAEALDLAAGVDSLIVQIEPLELRTAIETKLGEERGARGQTVLSLRRAIARADSLLVELESDTLSLRRELTLAEKQTAAAEIALVDMRAELDKALRGPSWLLRRAKEAAIVTGVVLVCRVAPGDSPC